MHAAGKEAGTLGTPLCVGFCLFMCVCVCVCVCVLLGGGLG